MSPNMRETFAWLSERGFIVGFAPLDCGHTPTPSGLGAGYATMRDNRRICYACADAATREEMKAADRIVLYLRDREITTWTGGVMARVTSRVTRKMRTPNAWRAHDRVYVRAIDLDGKRWYGSGPGDGMYIRLRASVG